MLNFFFSLLHFIKLYTLKCLALVGIKVVSEATYTDTYLETMIIVLGYSIMCYQNCDYCLPFGGALIGRVLCVLFIKLNIIKVGPFTIPVTMV